MKSSRTRGWARAVTAQYIFVNTGKQETNSLVR